MRFLLATISAVLMALGFYFWPLAFVALIPLIYALNHSKHKIKLGAYAGVLFALLNMIWHWGISLEQYGVEHSWPFIGFVWLISGLCGAWVGLWTYAFNKTQNVAFLAFWWAVCEVIRAWFIGLLWYAPGVMLGVNWTVGFLGYSIAESPFIALASLPGGVMILSGFIALVNLLVYNLPKSKTGNPLTDYWFQLALLITITGLFTYHFHIQSVPDEPLTVSMNIEEEADVILLYEGASKFTEWPEYENSLIIDSTDKKLRFLYTSDQSELPGNKFLLMPHGEYLPLITRPFIKLMAGDNPKVKELERTKITPISRLQYLDGVSILATACSDVMSWTLFSKVKPDIITNSASYSWFIDSDLLQRHAQQWARVRAVETGAWYYQNSNYGDNFKVNPQGELSFIR